MATQNAQTAFTKNAERLAKGLSDQVIKMEKLVQDARVAGSVIEQQAQQVEDLSLKITSLESDFDTQFRSATAELDLKIKENKDKVLDGLLKEFGLEKVTKADFAALNDALEGVQSDVETKISDAVNAASRSHHIEVATIKRDAEQALLLAQAQDKAKISSLEDKVAYLQDALEKASAQYDKLVEAHTKQEEHRSHASGATIYTSSK